MPLSKGQIDISKSDARFKVAVCGRRFGKTYLAMRELAKHASKPNTNIFYVAPTYRQAKQVMWDTLTNKLSSLNWVKNINKSDLRIDLVNGSTISLRGANNFDSMRGISLDYVCMDEFSYTNSKAWTEVLRPTLSDRLGSALFITTPAGQGNWSFDLFNRGQETNNDWDSFQFTTLDGGNVTESEVADARKDLDERTFRQEYEASFETFAGQIYYGFDVKRHVKEYDGDLDKITAINLFCDFNVNPMSAVVLIETEYGLHAIDEIVIYGSNTHELAEEVRNRYQTQKVTAYPDPASTQRKTSAQGRTDYSILQNAGFNMKVRRKHPAVRDRINAVNSVLAPIDGDAKLLISPKCKTLINCLIKQEYKEGTQVPDKDSGYDHLNDALGYGIEFIYPIRTQVEPLTNAQLSGWESRTF